MRCVHAKQRHKGCIRHQRHSKRRTLAPATDLRGTASGLSTALLTSLGVDRDDRVISPSLRYFAAGGWLLSRSPSSN